MTAAEPTADVFYDTQPTVLLIGDRPSDLEAAADAIARAGMRTIGTVPLAEGATALAMRSGPDIVMLEATDVPPAVAERCLTAIDALVRDRDIDVVVTAGEADTDTIAATLFGPNVQHLCNPQLIDRITALQFAGGARGMRLHDSSRDADDRLRRLNDEVARFADTLARLAGDGGGRPRFGGQVRDTSRGFRAERMDSVATIDANVVRDTIRSRRMRAAHFPPDLFADPAWDMLLDLFAAELEGRQVSVSSLCIAAHVPGTTALRWIGSMVEAGLFERYADPADRRRAFISLAPAARAGMEGYFDAIRRAGLLPA
ncbi:winged helix DNA-binding protein [Sphingomonas floccifaciens]|uniref:Winged helix DNA-binding protein n=1 Tax=Sphingomonas floccifaciens TaxID=1844115 RepID=A0ABW4NDH9_9SPHN